jgi:hypothetical protein
MTQTKRLLIIEPILTTNPESDLAEGGKKSSRRTLLRFRVINNLSAINVNAILTVLIQSGTIEASSGGNVVESAFVTWAQLCFFRREVMHYTPGPAGSHAN